MGSTTTKLILLDSLLQEGNVNDYKKKFRNIPFADIGLHNYLQSNEYK